MNNFEDRLMKSYYNLLVIEYDIMYSHINDSEYLKHMDSRIVMLTEFRKSCAIPINTFDEKVAFMLQFEEKIKEEERREEIEKLKKEKEALIELAKKRYDSKSFFWKLSHKSKKPDNINFEFMSNREIGELYSDDKKRNR